MFNYWGPYWYDDGDVIVGSRNKENNLTGGDGHDWIYGSNKNDTLKGGKGDDYLYGGRGSDTYLFDRGDGRDLINNYDTSSDKTDRLVFGEGINPDDIEVSRFSSSWWGKQHLVLKIKDTNDRVTIENYLYGDGDSPFKLEEIVFANGVVWKPEDVVDFIKNGKALPGTAAAAEAANSSESINKKSLVMKQRQSQFNDGSDDDNAEDSGAMSETTLLTSKPQ